MDISKYRDNTELSDISVIVEDQEFNLHKFPLSINCDYFKNECKNQNKVVLGNFFGGKSNFEIIADHCYGKDVELTSENVVSLYCSAEYLGMGSKGNLVEKCQKYIDRIFRSAEYSRSIESIIDILNNCQLINMEKLHPIVERGLGVVIQLWLRNLSNYKSHLKESYIEDSMIFDSLVKQDSVWIEKIIEKCSGDESKYPFIAKLVVTHIGKQMIKKHQKKEKINGKTKKANNGKPSTGASPKTSDCDEPEEDNSSVDESNKILEKKSLRSREKKRDNFDRIIQAIPDDLSLGKVATIDWLQQALIYCKKNECKSKNKLLQVCGGVLTHASVQELGSMDPSSITEMIDQALNNNKVDKDLMKWIWDHHFLEMAQNSELDPAVFNKVVRNMPESQDIDPDVVFKIVLSILNNIGSDGDKYKDDLINSVDMDKISPNNLMAAMESKFWKTEDVARIAIKRLQDQNKSSNRISTKDLKSTYDSGFDNEGSTNGPYSHRNLSSFKNHYYSSHLNSGLDTFEEDPYSISPEYQIKYYPTSKYVYSTYYSDNHPNLDDGFKYELNRISDSYADFYQTRYRSRSRRKFPICF